MVQVASDGSMVTVSGDWNGSGCSAEDCTRENEFASTSRVVKNTPFTVATAPSVMGMIVAGFVSPVGSGSMSSCKPVPVGPPPPPPVVGLARAGAGLGYWDVTSKGTVTAHELAQTHGDASGISLNAPVVAMASTPSGAGYWLVAADGGVFSYGDAKFYGSAGGFKLNAPAVGMAPTADSLGYWLVGSDGGIFTFGDAKFEGSEGGAKLAPPSSPWHRRGTGSVTGSWAAPAPDSKGYWLTAGDGGVFTYGSAKYYGSAARTKLARPVKGIALAPGATGYWLVATDGGVFSFGSAKYQGGVNGQFAD